MLRLLPTVLPGLLFSLAALGGPADAADSAVMPVKAVMDATVSNWAGGDSEWQDIFEDSRLHKLFSADFIRLYQAAQADPATDDAISPFDYDVIVGGQDACPLEELTITSQSPAGDKTEVVARFKKSTCMGADADYQAFTTVKFEVITEGGKPVIDDILTTDEDGKPSALKDVMKTIDKQQQ